MKIMYMDHRLTELRTGMLPKALVIVNVHNEDATVLLYIWWWCGKTYEKILEVERTVVE